MENNQPQVEVQEPDAQAMAQQQEAFNIGLDLKLRIKALEFAEKVIVASGQIVPTDAKRIHEIAGAAFDFVKFGVPQVSMDPIDKLQAPA